MFRTTLWSSRHVLRRARQPMKASRHSVTLTVRSAPTRFDPWRIAKYAFFDRTPLKRVTQQVGRGSGHVARVSGGMYEYLARPRADIPDE